MRMRKCKMSWIPHHPRLGRIRSKIWAGSKEGLIEEFRLEALRCLGDADTGLHLYLETKNGNVIAEATYIESDEDGRRVSDRGWVMVLPYRSSGVVYYFEYGNQVPVKIEERP